MDEKKPAEDKHEEHPGCQCGGVCAITGACGKEELRKKSPEPGDRNPEKREETGTEV